MKYADSGVNIDAATRALARAKDAVKLHLGRAGAQRRGGLRRPVPAGAGRAPAGGLGGRRGHQGDGGAPGGPLRHGGRGSGQPLRRRHPGPGRRAPVLPGLLRHQPAGRGRAAGGARGLRPGLPRQRLRPAGRRDRGDARRVRRGRVRPGRHHRRAACAQADVIDGSRIAAGDAVWGLPSTGLHTNGYSLARKVLLETAGLRGRPTRPPSWAAPAWPTPCWRCTAATCPTCGRCGGTTAAPPSTAWPTSPAAASMTTSRGWCPTACASTWTRRPGPCRPSSPSSPRKGGVAPAEMHRVFNMGIGMVVIAPADLDLGAACDAVRIGEVTAGEAKVRLPF